MTFETYAQWLYTQRHTHKPYSTAIKNLKPVCHWGIYKSQFLPISDDHLKCSREQIILVRRGTIVSFRTIVFVKCFEARSSLIKN